MKLLALELGTFEGLGPLGRVNGPSGASVFGQFEGLISTSLGVLTVSAGLWFVFQIFGGALGWLASGGEKQSLQNAQKRIVNAIVGLIVVVMSYTFIAIISSIIGLHILSPFAALNGALAP
jgi:uncharacterized membrane protein